MCIHIGTHTSWHVKDKDSGEEESTHFESLHKLKALSFPLSTSFFCIPWIPGLQKKFYHFLVSRCCKQAIWGQFNSFSFVNNLLIWLETWKVFLFTLRFRYVTRICLGMSFPSVFPFFQHAGSSLSLDRFSILSFSSGKSWMLPAAQLFLAFH